MIQAVAWKGDFLQLIDQTQLPEKLIYLDLHTVEEVFQAIRDLQVRGAPVIGIAAAYGLCLGMRDFRGASRKDFLAQLQQRIEYLSSARPTAVNLSWALRNLQSQLENLPGGDAAELKTRLLALAIELHEDDRRRCEAIAAHGQEAVPENARILTHCNTGALATGGIGTALGVVYRAHQLGKNIRVYAGETRPVLQGARLTAWELLAAKIPAQLICDNMAAALMQQGQVDLVLVGADRIAADGSAANKIGTYSLAVLAHYHRLPFYVAAPLSTFDMNVATGSAIPIEIRNSDEIRKVFGKYPITPGEVSCWNPAFDVTPPELITGIITERGILSPPYSKTIEQTINHTMLAGG